MRFVYPIVCVLILLQSAAAEVTVYMNKQNWINAVSSYETITFQGFPNGTLINNQYTNLGVRFTDGGDFIFVNNVFLNDGVGLRGGIPRSITVEFNAPQYWFAGEYPARNAFELYYQNTLIHVTEHLGGVGPGIFVGFISTLPFDRVRIFDNSGGSANVDDIYFGPIPAPGALPLLLTAACCARSRRRTLTGKR